MALPQTGPVVARRRASSTAIAYGNVALAGVALLVVSPLLLLLALLVRTTSHGRVLERTPHRAPDGEQVELLSFRTTVDGTRTEHHARLRATIGHDGGPPLTGVGRVLRVTRLHRLPRLLNVAAGHLRFF